MLRLLRPFPFTIVMFVALVSVAVWTRSHVGPLSPSTRRALGFAPLHIPKGEWVRLLSCTFFTAGGLSFYASAIMLAGSLGAAEKLYGTGRAMALFWGIHLVTLLLASLLLSLPLHALDFYRGTLLASARDVGPSAGYYGCLGAACHALPGKWRISLILVILVVLVSRLLWSVVTVPDHGRVMSANLSHLIAFPLGILAAGWITSAAPIRRFGIS